MEIKKTLYIQAIRYYFEDSFTIDILSHQMLSSADKVVIQIAEKEIVMEVPDMSDSALNEKHIEQLQSMRVQVLADNHLRLKDIDDEIASLLALENTNSGSPSSREPEVEQE